MCGLLVLLASCASDAYVMADRATFDAVAPEYRAYVQADPALDEATKANRLRTIETWQERLEAAEGKQ